ncbi:hypothetical protein RJ999_07935 [Aliarcobacter butzleri]|uniref:hypothetical protein n=1 Tax=Aliarcobacter butzleri TaxID=28197 RepID=UPI001EDB9D80|nr:hypothetical protein [Aliarcobacter butzleri]MCG3690148.1 hypothetical protein [Aliarcobacter butzleri]MDS1371021.1 hypothetical protein [Aliarcobacter butzleri]
MMEIISNLISKLSSKVLVGIIGVLFGAVVLLAIDNYFTSSSLDSTKKDLTKKEVELTNAKEDLKKAQETYEKNLALQIEIASNKAITLEAKKEVTKASSKVEEELKKRGEIRHDENENDFIIVEF